LKSLAQSIIHLWPIETFPQFAGANHETVLKDVVALRAKGKVRFGNRIGLGVNVNEGDKADVQRRG
jgi:hypothetical protein